MTLTKADHQFLKKHLEINRITFI